MYPVNVFDSCLCGTTDPQLNSVNSAAKLRLRSIGDDDAGGEAEPGQQPSVNSCTDETKSLSVSTNQQLASVPWSKLCKTEFVPDLSDSTFH
jgi:hypothetical protein